MARIAVVGATGPTGMHVVDQALARGNDVVAYVRRPEAVASRPNLTVVGGQLDDTDAFAAAVAGCDVVVCTLGTRSWLERGFMTKHLPFVTRAMQQAGVQRLVLMSALGGGPVPVRSKGIARLVFLALSKTIFADRTHSEEALQRTGIAHAMLYPGFLNDDAALPDVEIADVDDIRDVRDSKIPRANVAAVLVDLAEDPSSAGRRIIIAPKGRIKLA